MEPHATTGGPPTEASDVLRVSSSCHGPGENLLGDSVSAGAGLARLFPEASAFSKCPDVNSLPVCSHPGPGSLACPGRPEDVFSDFLYWRPPLPDISGDLELFLGVARPQDTGGSRPGPAHSGHVARSEIQKVLDSLQEHLIDDPDVQGECRPW